MSSNGWIGVDLDGTLAHYEGWLGSNHIGAPIPAMVERVKAWLADGIEVRIFTARVYPLSFVRPDDNLSLFCGANDREAQAAQSAIHILDWCRKVFGQTLPITCTKDYGMVELWDDRAVRVVANTGERCCSSV